MNHNLKVNFNVKRLDLEDMLLLLAGWKRCGGRRLPCVAHDVEQGHDFSQFVAQARVLACHRQYRTARAAA